jgi:hypothetical protein
MPDTRYSVTSVNRYNDKNPGAQPGGTTSFQIETLKSLGWRTLNVINGYGRFLRQEKAGKASALHEGEVAVAFDDNDDPFAEAPL